MIPEGLTNVHLQQAVEYINRHGVTNRRRSTRYDLIINGRNYPPKYVISIANRYLNHEEWPPTNFNAVEAKDYFICRGYEIHDRQEQEQEQ